MHLIQFNILKLIKILIIITLKILTEKLNFSQKCNVNTYNRKNHSKNKINSFI